MVKLFILIIFFIPIFIYSQNLVPNPSFEEYTYCPDSAVSPIENAYPWEIPSGWYSPDYFNSCTTGMYSIPNNWFGYQEAFNGDAYIGLLTYGHNTNYVNCREYIQAPLISELLPNHTYKVKFYISLADNFRYATDKIGAYFSVNPVNGDSSHSVIDSIPQVCNISGNIITDTTKWVEISGDYTAFGGEKYITIGNFSDSSNTQVIDLGQGDDWAYYYIDSVSVILDSSTTIEENKENDILISKIYPNPNSGQLFLEYDLPEGKKGKLIIYNTLGDKICSYRLQSELKTLIINKDLSNGIYFYKIVVDDKVIINEKLIIIR